MSWSIQLDEDTVFRDVEVTSRMVSQVATLLGSDTWNFTPQSSPRALIIWSAVILADKNGVSIERALEIVGVIPFVILMSTLKVDDGANE